MSVVAGRALLLVSGAVLVVCSVWFGIEWFASGQDLNELAARSVLPATFGLVAAVLLVVSVPLVSRFVEVEVGHMGDPTADGGAGNALVIRSVWRPRRSVPLADIDRVVLIKHFVLPARFGATSVLRAVVRTHDGSVIAFTPDGHDFERRLQRLGIVADVDPDLLRPGRAARRHP